MNRTRECGLLMDKLVEITFVVVLAANEISAKNG